MMKSAGWIILVGMATLSLQARAAGAASVYSGADDPAAVTAAADAVKRLDPGRRMIAIETPGAVPVGSKVVDIVGLKALQVKAGQVELEKVLTDLGARKVGQKIRVSLSGDVLFDFDQWDIRKVAEETLFKLVKAVNSLRVKEVLIEGHTDSKGPESYNLGLSRRRADAVKAWLVEKGRIPDSLIITRGYGETRPVAPNKNPDGSDNPEGRAKNRRVEIYITPES